MSARPAVQRAAEEAVKAGQALWQAGPQRRARWIAQACATLQDPAHAAHHSLVSACALASGLSPEMTRWALASTLSTLDAPGLLRLHAQAQPPHPGCVRARPGRLCAVVLSANVCTAAARALAVPLLFGWPVVAKASARDDALARHLATQLLEADPALGRALQVLSFARQDAPSLRALLSECDAASVYGRDETLCEVRAQLAASTSFIAHGSGLGLGLVTRHALADAESATRAARQLALDVAAYDGRGCLSPHAILVEAGGPVTAEQFAELLFHEGLAPLEASLPRGPLPLEVGSAQLSWRGLAAARGRLWEGTRHAVSFEGQGALRLSPGYRNVQVLELADRDALARHTAPLGVHLKCLGVAPVSEAHAWLEQLPAGVAPRVCEAGHMQTPLVDALSDGLPAAEGWVRWIDADR